MNHVLPTYLKLQSKTPFSQSTISQFRSLEVEIWVQGNLSSLPHNLQFPLLGDCGSKFQTCWTTFSPIELKLESKNPLSQETFSQFWILGGGSMDTGEPSLSSSQPFSIPSSWWLWVAISDLLCFYAFYALLLLVFWFSLVKTPLAFFFFLYIVNFGLDSPQINTSKEPNGRFGLFSHFSPLSQNVPDILATLLGSQVAEIREVMYPKMQNQQKDDVSHTNLSF